MAITISLNDSLLASAKEVFETMIFMSLEQCSEKSAPLNNDSLLGSITFKGSLEGCVSICCNLECAKVIASNMLGSGPDNELSDVEIYDAIGEVTNMIMGSFKSRILESMGEVQISIPSIVRGNTLNNVILEGQEQLSIPVMLDDHFAVLSLLSKTSFGQ